MIDRRAILVVAVVLLLAAAPQPQQAVTYERYEVELLLREDGSIKVTETYRLRFEGTFQEGFAEIPLDRAEDVTDIRMRDDSREYTAEGSGPGSFRTSFEGNSLWVDWNFEPTSGQEVRTFVLQYQVLGGLEVYRDRLVLLWDAVPADRSGVPVEAARLTVHLPPGVSASEVNTDGAAARVDTSGASTVVEATAPVPDGTALTARLTLPPDAVAAQTPDWQRWGSAVDYRWQAFDVDLTLQPDGELQVVERQRLQVTEGYLYSGWREIPWLYMDRIDGMEVWSDGQALALSAEPGDNRYVAEEKPGWDSWLTVRDGEVTVDRAALPRTLVEWAVPAIGPGESAEFTLRYTVHGALRIVEEGQLGLWTAVFADRDVPVEQATARLHLPPGVDPAAVAASAAEAKVSVESDGTILYTHDGPVSAGTSWDIQFTLPSGATTAGRPDWQQEMEAVAQEAQERATFQARVKLAAVGLGLLIFSGGTLLVAVIWFVWGRDKPVGLPADYLKQPPSDLPPGIVAYLVDEEPSVKGILADVLHLATLGLISVDLRQRDPLVTLNWSQPVGESEAVKLAEDEELVLCQHERTLFNAIQSALAKREDHQAPLSQVMKDVRGVLEAVYEQMAHQTSAFFSVQPSVAKQRWRWIGLAVLLSGSALMMFSFCLLAPGYGLVILAPMAALAGVGLVLMIVSRWMPRRTTKGAEEAARWRAFRRYLENLKGYGDLDSAQEILDEDFPYAVALGVEKVVLRQAESLGAQAPYWLVPTHISVGSASSALAGSPVSLGPAQGLLRGLLVSPGRLERMLSQPAPRPRTQPYLAPRRPGDLSLDGMSERMGSSLDNASASLGGLLDDAAGGPTLLTVLGKILEQQASGGGSGSYQPRSGGGWRSSSWKSSSRSSRSSSWRPSRSSGSRSSSRSGGGGRRGFG